MNILVAPDSFKGCLTSEQVAHYIEAGIKKADNDIVVSSVPIADGGEGTVSAFIKATNGKIIKVRAHDPLMREIDSFIGELGDGKTAIIEMCAASGITLLTAEERNPMITSTYGTGELIKAALDLDYRNIIIGVGGSATNDGGIGMAQALGVKFYDYNYQELSQGGGNLNKLSSIDMTGLDSRIYNCNITVACDVDNPLCGPNGSAYIFAAQKGATENDILVLDNNLLHFASIVKTTIGIDLADYKGAGAAGGLAGALFAFLNAKLKKGIDIIIEITNLEEKIKIADFVITGEGKIDNQTSYGKAPAGIAKMAAKYNKPVIGICGEIGDNVNELLNQGFTSIFSIVSKPMTLEESIINSPVLIEQLSRSITRLIL